MKYLALLLLALLLVVLACKKIEQPEMAQLNKECDCAKEVSADFVMEEKNSFWTDYLTETDSIFKNKNVRFRALEDSATYTWYIGQEVVTSKQVDRYFDEALAGQTLPITLVVKKKPNSICFPNDDGYDSITKYLTVTNFIESDSQNGILNIGSLEGTFRVKSDHLPDSFDITVDYVFSSFSNRRLNIFNYNGLGADCINQIEIYDLFNYRELRFWAGTGTIPEQCDKLQGSIKTKLDGSVEMNFTLYYTQILNYKGRRL
jgi:hypothetical protein